MLSGVSACCLMWCEPVADSLSRLGKIVTLKSYGAFKRHNELASVNNVFHCDEIQIVSY